MSRKFISNSKYVVQKCNGPKPRRKIFAEETKLLHKLWATHTTNKKTDVVISKVTKPKKYGTRDDENKDLPVEEDVGLSIR